MDKEQSQKEEILSTIFVSHKEVNEMKVIQKNKEIKELRKTIASQADLIKSIPEILAKIIRRNDGKGENYLLQEIFQEFCKGMDTHGVSYDAKKLELKIEKSEKRLLELKGKLNDVKENKSEGVKNGN